MKLTAEIDVDFGSDQLGVIRDALRDCELLGAPDEAEVTADRNKIRVEWDTRVTDDVSHPSHYTAHPSGVECITITEHMNFNLGNAIKYVWRAGLKSDDTTKDLRKAAWYITREIERLART